MSADALFARHTRPEVARLFRALHLDVAYSAGEGDHLTAGDGPVLDLVGGAGSSLFGHNHPALVEVARRCLDAKIPFNAQASIRSGAADLAGRLSAVVGATTGASYVVTLGSTGADAVEGAVKHATVEHRRRLGALQEEIALSLRRARRDDTPDVAGQLEKALALVGYLREQDPVFVSLRNAFHGKSTGAGTLTHGGSSPEDLHVPGPRHRRLYDWDPADVVTALDAELVPVELPHSGVIHLSPVAAVFVEPIQGEAGVHEVPAATLAALRELADRHGAALVFDEIQCGMGRTGTFLASAGSGVVADYYLFSKSLGGGLAKISALLVAEDRYVPDFGRHHTSTFAEDDFSSRIALAALDLALASLDRITEIGDWLRERLTVVAERWPDAIAEVRGRGLLLGVEFTAPRTGSGLLGALLDEESVGFLVAGRLLHTHRIRVIPTLSAPSTIRVQPSALLGEADVDRLVAALDDVAGLLSRGDYATLLEHLTVPPASEWQPPRHVPAARPAPSVTRRPTVAFLANLDSAASLRHVAPELASWSDDQCAAALDRMLGEARPFEVARRRVGAVEVVTIAAPFTAAQAVAALQAGHGPWLRRVVLDAVELGVSLGAQVIGLGAHTSIVTNAARDVVEDTVRVTSGNSLTAACAYDLLRQALDEAGDRRVGVVGGIGNIGAVMAELLAPHCESMLLVGRPGSGRRLAAVAGRLPLPAETSEDLEALRDCPIVVSATNSADPVILPSHLAGDRTVVVCDLAVPGDVHPAVAAMPNVRLMSGGRIQLPGTRFPSFPGITLPPGTLYSCLAETILLGHEPETPSPSYGSLTPAGVLAARDLAARHDFHPARIQAGLVTAQPWIVDAKEYVG
jgi:acetylornithine/succinyldiaminopimelate/putrescine aminotransferase/predicted amino acid dehydrogenase